MFLRALSKWRLAKGSALCFLFYNIITIPGEGGWLVHFDTMDTGRYLKEMAKQTWSPQSSEEAMWNGTTGDKIIVMSRMRNEDTDWVSKKLADWQHVIYQVPTSQVEYTPSSNDESLTLPANKGHEAMGYLTYLIDHYDALPQYILFLHPHEKGYKSSWHVDAPLHSNPAAVRALNLTLVKERGYVNLRCNPMPNCVAGDRTTRHPNLLTEELWRSFWANTSTPAHIMEAELKRMEDIDYAAASNEVSFSWWLSNLFSSAGPDEYPLPPIAEPGGAQFAVTREAARMRPRADYVSLRNWLLQTKEDDRVSGRVFEYLWHVLFGKPGVFCYERAKCECSVFGRCG